MGWKADNAHTHIMFSTRHMMISTVRGQFERFTIEGDINENDVAKSTLTVRIDPLSIDTRSEQRDNHLRSKDFFHTDEHPEIVFQSKRGEHLSDKHGKLIGDLTIRGVTKEVTLDVEFLGRSKSPWGTESAGFSAKTKINRKDWELNWNVALETGGWLVSDEVTLDIEAEFVKTPDVVPAPAAPAALPA